jgi:hypothetical protein
MVEDTRLCGWKLVLLRHHWKLIDKAETIQRAEPIKGIIFGQDKATNESQSLTTLGPGSN